MGMNKRKPQHLKLLALSRRKGILRARELSEAGIHHETLRRLLGTRQLQKMGRGLYMLSDAEITADHSLAEASKLVPHGVVCLLSALRFHEIGTQAPHEVWLAIDRRRAYPRVSSPKLRVLRFSGSALTAGVQEHVV